MICLYDKNTTNFNNNGLVVLNDCKFFYTTEKLNGLFEVDLEYPLDSRGKWQYIVRDNIVKNSDGQLFRIYNVEPSLDGIKANARHIFYDLLDNFLEDVRPENTTGAAALNYILTHTQYAHPFISASDVGGSSTKYFVEKNPIEAIMGQDGIIANWGGELVRDNFTIKLLQQRGVDRGVLISYGKNIQGLSGTNNEDNVITRIYPKGKDGLTLTEKYVDSQYINNYPHPKIKVIEFSDLENEADLRTTTQNYFLTSKCDIPLSNYTIGFLELSKTEEYKKYAILETVYLGDTVTVKHSRLKIDLKCKVILIKKNDLSGRIENVELGNFKPNLASSFSNLTNLIKNVSIAVAQSTSDWQNAVDNATNLITTALGGNVIKEQGQILIMDTEDKNTATKVWRWNLNGLGYSGTGINGPYALAMTMDGHIVASFITGLVISGEQINGGTITGVVIQTANSGNRLALKDNVLTAYNSSNIRTAQIAGDKFNFFDNSSGAAAGYIQGMNGTLKILADTMVSLGMINDINSGFSVNGDYHIGSGELMPAQNTSWAPLASNRFRGNDNAEQFNLGSGNCRVDTSGGVLRLQADASNYVSVQPSGEIDFYTGGVRRGYVNSTGWHNG